MLNDSSQSFCTWWQVCKNCATVVFQDAKIPCGMFCPGIQFPSSDSRLTLNQLLDWHSINSWLIVFKCWMTHLNHSALVGRSSKIVRLLFFKIRKILVACFALQFNSPAPSQRLWLTTQLFDKCQKVLNCKWSFLIPTSAVQSELLITDTLINWLFDYWTCWLFQEWNNEVIIWILMSAVLSIITTYIFGLGQD